MEEKPIVVVVRVSLQMLLGVDNCKSFMIYTMARILDQVTQKDAIKGYRLFVMNSKVTRRVYKLQDHLLGFVLGETQAAVDRAHLQIEKEWLKV